MSARPPWRADMITTSVLRCWWRIAVAGNGGTLDVGGRSVKVTNLDKVLYPATETTKGEVLNYYCLLYTSRCV